LTVRARSAKNRRLATLPLPAGTIAALRAAGGPGSASERVLPSVPNMDTFRRDLKAAGLEYETTEGVADFHSLRVTFNTLLARAGVSLAQRQALMRHSDPKLTANVYTRLEAADAVAAVEKIDAPTVPKTYPKPCISTRRRALRGTESA
jgi:integrase/recombinase XerC